jgi:hypothetical protein
VLRSIDLDDPDLLGQWARAHAPLTQEIDDGRIRRENTVPVGVLVHPHRWKKVRDRGRREQRLRRDFPVRGAERLEGALEHVARAHQERWAIGLHERRQRAEIQVLADESSQIRELRAPHELRDELCAEPEHQ